MTMMQSIKKLTVPIDEYYLRYNVRMYMYIFTLVIMSSDFVPDKWRK
jgi:hypothetical protein